MAASTKEVELRMIRYSEISVFQECRRMYYWQFIRNLEKNEVYVPYLIGTVFQYGLKLMLLKDKDVKGKVQKFYKHEVAMMRKNLAVPADIEQELQETESIVLGMVLGYQTHYAKELDSLELIENEKEVVYRLPDLPVAIMGHIDNEIRDKKKKKKYIHELKTTKGITDNYIKAIQTNLQTSGYFHIYNMTEKDRIDGIMYDVIRKPSIRQKKDESYRTFLERLHNYYKSSSPADVFYMELIDEPIVVRSQVLEIFNGAARDMLNCHEKADYYQNLSSCNNYGQCKYFKLCFEGETKKTLSFYRERRPERRKT